MLDSGQARCELPLGLSEAGLEDRDVILGVRPEQLIVNGEAGSAFPGVRAQVQVTEPTGPDTLVFVTLNDTKVCCRVAPDDAPAVGEVLDLRLDPGKVLLFDAASGERLGLQAATAGQPYDEKVAGIGGR